MGSRSESRVKDVVVWIGLGLFFGGMPAWWFAFSRKSVLLSTNADFINGFFGGAVMTLLVITGAGCVTVGLLRGAGRLNASRRRCPECGAVATGAKGNAESQRRRGAEKTTVKDDAAG